MPPPDFGDGDDAATARMSSAGDAERDVTISAPCGCGSGKVWCDWGFMRPLAKMGVGGDTPDNADAHFVGGRAAGPGLGEGPGVGGLLDKERMLKRIS